MPEEKAWKYKPKWRRDRKRWEPKQVDWKPNAYSEEEEEEEEDLLP
jgi:hypothetical protein